MAYTNAIDKGIADTERVRTVTGCADCPFCQRQSKPAHCGLDYHVLRALDNWTPVHGRPYPLSPLDVNRVPPLPAPDWCPLREGDITVRLER